MLCYAMLFYAKLNYAILCYGMLCYEVLWKRPINPLGLEEFFYEIQKPGTIKIISRTEREGTRHM